MSRNYLTLLSLLVAIAAGCSKPTDSGPYDLVITNGRVINPAGNQDAIGHVGVRGGTIAAISDKPLAGKDTIDATGLVVSPGFIDLHSHSVGWDGQKWQVRDGVTTALELEEGSYPVAEWYARLEGKSLINHGVSAGHIPARIAVIAGAKTLDEAERVRLAPTSDPPPAWSHGPTTPEHLAAITKVIEAGLDAGGLGIGFEINESPGASREEILTLFQIAARRGVAIYAHPRQMGVDPINGSLAGAQEILANAAATGAATHFVHLGSSGGIYARTLVEMIKGARKEHLDVTGEVYPYTASSTGIQTGFFDGDWQSRIGMTYADIEWPPTGERMTAATFAKFRKQGGTVIMHWMKDENVEFLIAEPNVMIASDAMPLPDGKGHPRGVGTFARVLGRYVREKKTVDLVTALRKMTIYPAERGQRGGALLIKKGRMLVGADADITIFDPATVIDRATFENPQQASAGVPYVIVNGTVVVRKGEIVPNVFPGRAVKGTDH